MIIDLRLILFFGGGGSYGVFFFLATATFSILSECPKRLPVPILSNEKSSSTYIHGLCGHPKIIIIAYQYSFIQDYITFHARHVPMEESAVSQKWPAGLQCKCKGEI